MPVAKPKFAPLKFPLGGVYRRLALAQQPRQTTYSALNVWPDDVTGAGGGAAHESDERETGGSRPGTKKFFSTQISGGSNKIRLVRDFFWQNSNVLTNTLMASADGKLYRQSSATAFTEIANYGGLTLASDRPLTATDFDGIFYIAGDNSSHRYLLKYTPGTDTLATVTASAGSVPENCTLCARHYGRLYLAGQTTNPHVWYASRQNDPTDWDTGGTGVDAAVDATSSPDTGSIGEPIIALMPHAEGCLVFGLSNSVVVLQGDPLQGGRFVSVSAAAGLFGSHAWCHDSDMWLWFVALDGLWTMPPGCGSLPIPVSREKWPRELLDFDRTVYTASMAYNKRYRGIELYVTKNATGETARAYWIKIHRVGQQSVADVSIWPMELGDENHDVFYAYARRDYVASDRTKPHSGVVLGCRDGYLRHFDSTYHYDDATGTPLAIDSHVYLGPFPLAEFSYEAIIAELEMVASVDSGAIEVTVYTGQTAESTVSDPLDTATYTFIHGGVNPRVHPRMRGAYVLFKLAGKSAGKKWSWQDFGMLLEAGGRRRFIG